MAELKLCRELGKLWENFLRVERNSMDHLLRFCIVCAAYLFLIVGVASELIRQLFQNSLPTGGGRCHNLKNGKEASEDTEESPAGCAVEGK